MKLSEAIRIGATLRPQVYGEYVGSLSHEEWGTCAVGAALEAVKGEAWLLSDFREAQNVGVEYDAIAGVFPVIEEHRFTRYICPDCKERSNLQSNLLHFIAHLNDAHEKTRGWIADYLESMGL